jgi:hypothetical protein
MMQILQSPTEQKKEEKLLVLKNVSFFKGGCQVPYQSPDLELADSISITFEMQKNNDKKDMVW